MPFQIEGYAGGQWHWTNVSANRDEDATIFDTEAEAKRVIPKLAKSLECSGSDLRIVERREIFAARLRSIRFAANLTVTDLADAAGLSRQTIYNYESGKGEPTWDIVQKLADALDVSTDSFRVGMK